MEPLNVEITVVETLMLPLRGLLSGGPPLGGTRLELLEFNLPFHGCHYRMD